MQKIAYKIIQFLHVVFLLQELSVTDDTVLEAHNEDPGLVQMKLIGDGGEYLCHFYSCLMFHTFARSAV